MIPAAPRALGSALAAVLLLSSIFPATANTCALQDVGTDRATEIRGYVLDASGAAVAGAVVTVDPVQAVRADAGPADVVPSDVVPLGTAPSGTASGPAQSSTAGEARTGADGSFSIHAASAVSRLTVRAGGFATTTLQVDRDARTARPVTIVLYAAPLAETVVVTPSRGIAPSETGAAATVFSAADLAASPAGALDDVLRETPGFSLFRRSSSRVANPTTQGVTLRGVSASGASRTLVLADGLPLNDPFGSWVYWNRIPLAAVDRVEVVRGAAGDAWGADALGGVIQVLTHAAGGPRVRGTLEYGEHDTVRGSFYGAAARAGWWLDLAAEATDTHGVPVIAEDARGPVDVRAWSDYATGFASAGYAGDRWRLRGRGAIYSEDRGNGTLGQVNSTRWRDGSLEAGGTSGWGTWTARAAVGTQTYRQTFTAVAPGRASERLTSSQQIPSRFETGSVAWAATAGGVLLLAGGETRRVRGDVEETRYTISGEPLGPLTTGGRETGGGAFLRASVRPSPSLTLVAGARADAWKSDATGDEGPRRSLAFLSPRVSCTWQLSSRVSVQAAAYGAHRVPTLNELHRGFRVGNVVTLANPELEPERLAGAETGMLVRGSRWSARSSLFWNRIEDAIANITLEATPATIVRQRRNADRLTATGLELEAEFQLRSNLSLSGMATAIASRFGASASDPELEGNYVPQVARWQMGAGVTYVGRESLTLDARVRAVGPQYEDDLNRMKLDPFAVVDVYAGRALSAGVQAFAAVENLFDIEYVTGLTPVPSVGWPRTVRAGVRVAWR